MHGGLLAWASGRDTRYWHVASSTTEPTVSVSGKRYRQRYGAPAVAYITCAPQAEMRNVLATVAVYAGP